MESKQTAEEMFHIEEYVKTLEEPDVKEYIMILENMRDNPGKNRYENFEKAGLRIRRFYAKFDYMLQNGIFENEIGYSRKPEEVKMHRYSAYSLNEAGLHILEKMLLRNQSFSKEQ